MTLDPTRVPESLRHLIPLAERWGESDDGVRDLRLDAATVPELHGIVEAVQRSDEEFEGWLGGEESFSPTPSDEYVSFSSLFMAYERAKLLLRKREHQSG